MEEQNVIPLTHCFLDTNVFLHFQRFDTVDWPKVLGAQQVCLMLTTTVMEELNYHKDDSKIQVVRNEHARSFRDWMIYYRQILPVSPFHWVRM